MEKKFWKKIIESYKLKKNVSLRVNTLKSSK